MIEWITRCLSNSQWVHHSKRAVCKLDPKKAADNARAFRNLFDKAKTKPKDALSDPRLPKWRDYIAEIMQVFMIRRTYNTI
jgi:hypothetical protein